MVSRPYESADLRRSSNSGPGANLEMVRIDAIRESNAKAKGIEGLVAAFVGGTGGIGESTAKELFLRTTRPRAYIIGRFGVLPPQQPRTKH